MILSVMYILVNYISRICLINKCTGYNYLSKNIFAITCMIAFEFGYNQGSSFVQNLAEVAPARNLDHALLSADKDFVHNIAHRGIRGGSRGDSKGSINPPFERASLT